MFLGKKKAQKIHLMPLQYAHFATKYKQYSGKHERRFQHRQKADMLIN